MSIVTRLIAPALLALFTSNTWAAHAIVAAEAKNEMFYYWNINQPNQEKAEKKALASCNSHANKKHYVGNCKVIGSGTGPKYIAFFHTNDGKGFGVLSDERKDQALAGAHNECSKWGKCPDKPVKVSFDEGEKGKKAQQFTQHTRLNKR